MCVCLADNIVVCRIEPALHCLGTVSMVYTFECITGLLSSGIQQWLIDGLSKNCGKPVHIMIVSRHV